MTQPSALPKYEDWNAPWEVDSTGEPLPVEDQKLDPARLKKYLHNLLTDKERLQATVTTVTGERDTLRTQLDSKAREGEGDEERREREKAEAIAAAKGEGALQALKLEVALDVPGITPAQAKRIAARLTGKDRDELEADAKGLAEDFGIGKSQDSDDEDDEPTAARRPRRLSSSGDPAPTTGKLPDASDPEQLNKLFPRR